MALTEDFNKIPKLFGDAVEQLGKLVRNEIQLARAELAEKLMLAGIGACCVIGAAIVSIPVLVVLLVALALWLTQLGLSPALAHLASAGCGAAVSGVLAFVGLSYLKPARLKPTITIQQLGRDIATAKEVSR